MDDLGLDSSLLYTRADGTQAFVHDTLDAFFQGIGFAVRINDKSMTAEDFLTLLEPYLRKTPADDAEGSIESYIAPDVRGSVATAINLINDPNDFIRQITSSNFHLAARLIWFYEGDLEESVKAEVAAVLDAELDCGKGDTIEMVVESLGATKSTRAVPALKIIMNNKIHGGLYVGKAYGEKKEFFSLSHIHDESAIAQLYDFMTQPTLITGRHPPYMYSAMRALEDYMDPDLLANFILKEFTHGDLYLYDGYAGESKNCVLDRITELQWPIYECHIRERSFIYWKLHMIKERPYESIGFNPDENITTDEIGKMFVQAAASARSKEVLVNLATIAYSEQTHFDSDFDSELSSSNCTFADWKTNKARKWLNELRRSVLENALLSEIDGLHLQYGTANAELGHRRQVNSTERVGEVYTRQEEDRQINYTYVKLSALTSNTNSHPGLVQRFYEFAGNGVCVDVELGDSLNIEGDTVDFTGWFSGRDIFGDIYRVDLEGGDEARDQLQQIASYVVQGATEDAENVRKMQTILDNMRDIHKESPSIRYHDNLKKRITPIKSLDDIKSLME